MGQLLDADDAADDSLADGDSLTVTVSTDNGAGDVTLTITDGDFDPSAPSEPASYDLLVLSHDPGIEASADYRPIKHETGITDFRHTVPAVPDEIRAIVTNQSGGAEPFAVTSKAHR